MHKLHKLSPQINLVLQMHKMVLSHHHLEAAKTPMTIKLILALVHILDSYFIKHRVNVLAFAFIHAMEE